ncbi:MAG TPA: filamentous hemagglutinin N-terminal domain-containing protein, partial [Xanthobacteraceae bacterium]
MVGGAATVQGAGSASVTVNQSSSSAIINWHTFNIGANESVRFNQPSSSSVALNRVTGGLGPSEILGSLTANGRIFLINRDGILFGPGAVVNTAGFLASTNDIKNSDFMAGRYNFNIPGRPDASIVNQGRITATSGGFAALVAPGVRNSGTITATLGTVALASGNSFTLDMYGDKLITLAVGDEIAAKVKDVATGKPLKSLVTNDGKIRANGGRVELTAAAARTIVDSVINTRGVIKANSIGRHNGMIVLAAATAGSKGAGLPTQTVKISGKLSVAGRHRNTKGGTIVVTGENIKLAHAKLDASGRAGGGKVLIGGDWAGGHPDASLVNNASAQLEAFAIPTATTVSLDSSTVINGSATERGNGGKVVLWSDTQTTFSGTILARGGPQGGDGGFVETSSHGQLAFRGNVDSSAPRGKAGTLLLDPADFFIRQNCVGDGGCGNNETTATIIQGELQTNNVVINTNPGPGNGDIFVQASINWATNNSLTLSAYHDINIYGAYYSETPVIIKNTAGGNLVLRADNTGIGSGTVNFQPIYGQPGQVDFSQSIGKVAIFYNPSAPPESLDSKYQHPTNYLWCGNNSCGGVIVNSNQPSQLTAYMLVNGVSDLQAVGTNAATLAGTYALGKSFSASGFTSFAAGATFTGTFTGNGGLGPVNYTISDLAVALFPTIGTGATVQQLNLADVNIAATTSPTFVAALAGENRGTVSDVHVLSGTVSGGSQIGVAAGGLVGQNKGVIENSSSAAAVSVGDSNSSTAFNIAGGLVATNLGTITGSSASGSVSGGAFSLVGGLVGQNGLVNVAGGSITSSFAIGSVTATGLSAAAGGLVGVNSSDSTISASYALGNVAATGSVPQNSSDCGASNTCQNVAAGGLVGQNFGTVSASNAWGDVSVGA